MLWKIIYEKNGHEDCLWFGSLVDAEERDKRLKAYSEMGYTILGCYKVNSIA